MRCSFSGEIRAACGEVIAGEGRGLGCAKWSRCSWVMPDDQGGRNHRVEGSGDEAVRGRQRSRQRCGPREVTMGVALSTSFLCEQGAEIGLPAPRSCDL